MAAEAGSRTVAKIIRRRACVSHLFLSFRWQRNYSHLNGVMDVTICSLFHIGFKHYDYESANESIEHISFQRLSDYCVACRSRQKAIRRRDHTT